MKVVALWVVGRVDPGRVVVETQWISLHAEESPFRWGFTHAHQLVDCRPDTRRKAATGGTSGEFVCYLRYLSGFLREIRHPSCHPLIAANPGGTLMVALKRLDPSPRAVRMKSAKCVQGMSSRPTQNLVSDR